MVLADVHVSFADSDERQLRCYRRYLQAKMTGLTTCRDIESYLYCLIPLYAEYYESPLLERWLWKEGWNKNSMKPSSLRGCNFKLPEMVQRVRTGTVVPGQRIDDVVDAARAETQAFAKCFDTVLDAEREMIRPGRGYFVKELCPMNVKFVKCAWRAVGVDFRRVTQAQLSNMEEAVGQRFRGRLGVEDWETECNVTFADFVREMETEKEDTVPTTCPGAACNLLCMHGRQLDVQGCQLCRCNPRPEPECPSSLCYQRCESGYMTDKNGCPTCQCNEEEKACIRNGVSHPSGKTFNDECGRVCFCSDGVAGCDIHPLECPRPASKTKAESDEAQ